ncbi:HAD family hydrolase [Microbacterium sp. CJ88]|uniref:HAD family hydrolase n=1 Tax=Microbacterium sp. CJ88 TaxID=3445672 RepID=UPI003F65D9CA
MGIERLAHPKVVFLDVGGPLYDDDNFVVAVTSALDELRAAEGRGAVDRGELRALYDGFRNGDGTSLRTALAERFLGSASRRGELHERTRAHWVHPAGTLYPDALPFLAAVAAHAPIGVLANQEAGVIDALRRDGAGELISIWGVSAVVGYEKPSRELFEWCLDRAGAEPGEAVHIGNRFDNDVLPAHELGLGTVWVLRGEAPDVALPEQAAVADLVVPGLAGVDRVLFP